MGGNIYKSLSQQAINTQNIRRTPEAQQEEQKNPLKMDPENSSQEFYSEDKMN